VNTKIEQRGFTLIELVVVITILGILAAFAVPRFASLEGQARTAATQALAGSIRSGASLAHALWLANGDPSSTSVTMEGTSVAMVFGYPTAAGIESTLVEFAGFTPTTVGAARVFNKTTPGGTSITDCQVSYSPPLALNGAPSVSSTTTGCL
jgi:MSHA pilin protein MshA